MSTAGLPVGVVLGVGSSVVVVLNIRQNSHPAVHVTLHLERIKKSVTLKSELNKHHLLVS